MASPTNELLAAIHMLSPNEGWVTGDRVFLKWDGTSWSLFSYSSDTIRLYSLYVLSSGEGWAVGANRRTERGTIFHWDGSSWGEVASSTRRYLGAVHLSSPEDGWVIGESGTILRLTPLESPLLALLLVLIADGIVIACAAIVFWRASKGPIRASTKTPHFSGR